MSIENWRQYNIYKKSVNISLRRTQEQEQEQRQKSDRYSTALLISCAKIDDRILKMLVVNHIYLRILTGLITSTYSYFYGSLLKNSCFDVSNSLN